MWHSLSLLQISLLLWMSFKTGSVWSHLSNVLGSQMCTVSTKSEESYLLFIGPFLVVGGAGFTKLFFILDSISQHDPGHPVSLSMITSLMGQVCESLHGLLYFLTRMLPIRAFTYLSSHPIPSIPQAD